jgi:hypothetical protein
MILAFKRTKHFCREAEERWTYLSLELNLKIIYLSKCQKLSSLLQYLRLRFCTCFPNIYFFVSNLIFQNFNSWGISMQNTSCVGAYVIVTQWFFIFNNFNRYRLFFSLFFYEFFCKLFCVEHQFGGMIHSNLFQLVIFPKFRAQPNWLSSTRRLSWICPLTMKVEFFKNSFKLHAGTCCKNLVFFFLEI